MVALIDAARWSRLWPDRAGLGYLLRWQVERADVVLITKADAASEEQLKQMVAEMRVVRADVEPVAVVLSDPGAATQILAALEEAVRC